MDIQLEKLSRVFTSAFEEEVKLTLDTKKEDLEAWDSINHLNLIVELESEFDVTFDSHEIEGLNSIKNLIQLLKSKI
jgi:acyl carrier protein